MCPARQCATSPRAKEKHVAAICRACGPEMRTIATAATPGGVAIAAIVSEKRSVCVAVFDWWSDLVSRRPPVARPKRFAVAGIARAAIGSAIRVAIARLAPCADHNAPVEADARAFGGQVAMRGKRHVDDAAFRCRHRFEFDVDAVLQRPLAGTQRDAAQRCATPRAIAFDVDGEKEIAIAFAVHHRVRHDGERVEHVAALADEQAKFVVTFVIAIVLARPRCSDAADVDDDLTTVAGLLHAAETQARGQAERVDETGEEIARVLERGAQLGRALFAPVTIASAFAAAPEPAARTTAAVTAAISAAAFGAASARAAIVSGFVSVHRLKSSVAKKLRRWLAAAAAFSL
jgi:hypothetical protein